MTSSPTPQLWRWMMLCAAVAGMGAAIFGAPGLADTSDIPGYHLRRIAVAERSQPTPYRFSIILCREY